MRPLFARSSVGSRLNPGFSISTRHPVLSRSLRPFWRIFCRSAVLTWFISPVKKGPFPNYGMRKNYRAAGCAAALPRGARVVCDARKCYWKIMYIHNSAFAARKRVWCARGLNAAEINIPVPADEHYRALSSACIRFYRKILPYAPIFVHFNANRRVGVNVERRC